MFGRKRAFQSHGPGIGAAQHGAVVARRGERCAEQCRSPPGGKAGIHKGGGVKAEQLPFQFAAPGCQLGDKMRVVPLCRPGDILHRKVELEQLSVGIGLRVGLQPVLQGRLQAEQQSEQLLRQLLQKDRSIPRQQRLRQREGGFCRFGVQKAGLLGEILCRRFGGRWTPAGGQLRYRPARFQKAPVCLCQRGFQCAFSFADGPSGIGQAALAEPCRVHGSGPVRQVVGFVDEKNVVARRIEKAPQVHGGVEQIVVVSDDHITPLAQVQPQLKGADPVPPGSLGQGGPVIGDGAVQQVGQRILQPLVVAVGVGAGFRQAGGTALSILAQAGLLLGRKGHAAQGKRRVCRPQTGQCILSSGLCRVAGGQVEDLFPLALAHGFQGREEGTHRFADAGGCLAEQPGTALLLCLARSTGAIDLPGKGTLPGTVSWKRKLQGPKAPVPGFHPVQLPPRPGKILPQ